MTETQACELLEATLTLERVQAETDVAARLMQRCRFHPLALDIAARLILKLANDGVAQPQAAIENRVAQQIAALKAGNDERTNLFAVFQISYDDLNAGDQTRFQKLAVFAPGVFGLMHRLLLSVSTIGTNELQLDHWDECVCAGIGFQFPQSERTNCNGRILILPTNILIAFSFHNRNERTATFLVSARQAPFNIFQFPQSERTNCNSPARARQPDCVPLSVSTIGTNELQLRLRRRRAARRYSFSFHNRNERTATNRQPHRLTFRSRLSVSTIGTNELQLVSSPFHTQPEMIFQFPQSERTNCNPSRTTCSCILILPFSFHNEDPTKEWLVTFFRSRQNV